MSPWKERASLMPCWRASHQPRSGASMPNSASQLREIGRILNETADCRATHTNSTVLGRVCAAGAPTTTCCPAGTPERLPLTPVSPSQMLLVHKTKRDVPITSGAFVFRRAPRSARGSHSDLSTTPVLAITTPLVPIRARVFACYSIREAELVVASSRLT